MTLSTLLCACLAASGFAAAASSAPDGPGAPVSVDRGSRVLSESLRDALRRIGWEFAKTESGRRLAALTESVAVEERRSPRGRAIRWERGETPSIVVDRDRAKRLSLLDFEIAMFRARWIALADMPIDLADTEWAARQAVLEYALDKAAADPDFEKELRRATASARRTLTVRKRDREYAREHGARAEVLFPGQRPKTTLDALAFDLYLASEDFQFLYESLRAAEDSDAPELDAVAGCLEAYGARLGEAEFHAGGSVALIGGRRVPGPVARATIFVENESTLAELRERLGPFRGVGAEALLRRINQWLRDTP